MADFEKVSELLKKYDNATTIYELKSTVDELDEIRKDNLDIDVINEHPEYLINRYHSNKPVVIESDDNNTDYVLTNNQRFLKKFLSLETQNKGALLFHGVGVGKTCTSIQIAESFNVLESDINQCIIVASDLLLSNFKRELFDVNRYIESLKSKTPLRQCVGDKYVLDDLAKLKNDEIKKKVGQLIKTFYKFITYDKFAKEVNKNNTIIKQKTSSEEQQLFRYHKYLKTKFSNKLFIIDEVQSLRSVDNKNNKQIPKIIRDIVSNASNVRILFLSATPIYDDPKEIIWLMNTLLANDNKPLSIDVKDNLFGDDGLLKKNIKKKLSQFANQYVSYMRGENPNTFPTRIYPSINKDINILKTYPKYDTKGENIQYTANERNFNELIQSEMSKSQIAMYNTLFEQSEKDELSYDDKEFAEQLDSTKSNVQSLVQISNIIFSRTNEQDTSAKKDSKLETILKQNTGKKGFRNIFEEKNPTSSSSYKITYKPNVEPILDTPHLKKHSPKIHTILEYIKNAEGIVLVYSQYLYSGLIPLALALEHIGYTRLVNDKKQKLSNITSKSKSPFSYSILSGNKTISPNNSNDVNVIRSEKNKNGEMVKVILISQSAAEGVDFRNIREVHILEPWYNFSRLEQIIGRGVRFNSHASLDETKRNVTIYMHVNTFGDKRKNNESIDLRIYRIARNKQLQISQINRILKEGAFDCILNKKVLHYQRLSSHTIELGTSQGKTIKNWKVGDIENSSLCDYMECNYDCNVRMNKTIPKNYSLKQILIESDLVQIKSFIQQLFTKRNVVFMKYEDIKAEFLRKRKDVDESTMQTLLNHTLNNLVKTKNTFKLQGRDGYLIYKSNKYIFQPTEIEDLKILISDRRLIKTFKAKHFNLNSIIETRKTEQTEKKLKEPVNFIEIKTPIFNDMKKFLSNAIGNTEIQDEIIWSILIDGLEQKDFMQLSFFLRGKKIKNQCFKKALIGSGLFLLDTTDEIKTFYNIFMKKYMCVDTLIKENLYTECDGIDAKELKEYQKELLDDNLNGFLEGKTQLLGFVDAEKNVKFRIALKDKLKNDTKGLMRIRGSSCKDTSSFKKEVMTKYITEIVETNADIELSIAKLNKEELCIVYEYLLRINSERLFLRPFFFESLKEAQKQISKKN